MKKNTLENLLCTYEPFINGIVELLYPVVEAAVHDLVSGKIVALFNNISHRNVGDASPLKELKVNIDEFPDYFPPYYKRNWDGRQLKCISITLRDPSRKPIGLVCFNVDTSVMQDAYSLLNTFLKLQKETENPIEAFGGSYDEQAAILIQEYLTEKKLSLQHLNRSQKKDLVQHLYHKGLFNFKNAAPALAHSLKLSRASLYNYINEIGDKK